MGLSRLENFLKNVRGEVLYVDPSSLDSTDAIDNQGNSLARPFKTIQRALVEAARFSYQRGLNNDRFNKTTIILYPGEHIVDNRPGYIPLGNGQFRLRSGATTNNFFAFDSRSNFDVTTSNNDLFKLNSVHGGVILPRGTSIVGIDLRKTKIRPTYVPNPENDDIERSAIFRLTGGCYIWQFSIFDGNPNGTVYKDYTPNKYVPSFSHHKLTAFEYADGVNSVSIDDTFLTYSTDRTDLELYYQKIGLSFGAASGREIPNDYPSADLDIEPVIGEYEIVGSRGDEVGITSIYSGDGIVSSSIVTVELAEEFPAVNVDTPIRITGVPALGYNGSFTVLAVNSPTELQYKVSSPPFDPAPILTSSSPTLNIVVDTVNSASPYIFNVSLRSVYGMCGLFADGSKADGFKSMVVAQFTGISLQKDDNAFVKYNSSTGTYDDNTTVATLHTNSRSSFKPKYENYHVKCSNNAFLQLVSVFAIGYSNQFLVESGGDQSITNSNSNFGAKSLTAFGFRDTAFAKDDTGIITHVISPREIEDPEITLEYYSIDVQKTLSVGDNTRLYLYGQTNKDIRPDNVFDGYRIGAKDGDSLNVLLNNAGTSVLYSAKISTPNGQFSSKKSYKVQKNGSLNSISEFAPNVITLTQAHSFQNGESVRVLSDDGRLPDGLVHDKIYYVITSGLNITNPNQSRKIKLAQTLNEALNDSSIALNSAGGNLTIESRVSDKISGEIGHPVQFDSTTNQWYINVYSSGNQIYSAIQTLGISVLGESTPRTYFHRIPDTRTLKDKIYQFRYIIPKNSRITARPPIDGFVIQESNSTTGSTDGEISKYYTTENVSLNSDYELRNFRFIANASWDISTLAEITTELPHGLSVGAEVEILNVSSTANLDAEPNKGFNGTFTVNSIADTKTFRVIIKTNPGLFTNETYIRDRNLPYFKKKKHKNVFYAYKFDEIQEYIPGQKDGIYHLVCLNASNKPSISPFTDFEFSQPIQNLYPEFNRDQPVSDPISAISYAIPDPIGRVVTNNPQYSITKENIEKINYDFNIGIGITNVRSTPGTSGIGHSIFTTFDHGLNRITKLSISDTGSGYGDGVERIYYNVKLVGDNSTGVNATASVKVSAAGSVTSVKIMDGGSAYSVGNTLSLVGIGTSTSGYVPASVSVTGIYNNVGDIITLSGIKKEDYLDYNTTYRITRLVGGDPRQINVVSSDPVGIPTASLSSQLNSNVTITLSGSSVGISTISYNSSTGIGTVTTVRPHGFNIDNKVRVRGFVSDFYNGDYIIKEVPSLTTFNVSLGSTTSVPAVNITTPTVHRYGYSSNGGVLSDKNEDVSGRLVYEYAGITTAISAAITNTTSETISISNATDFDFNIGDYLLIDNEIFRIKQTVTTSSVSVFRGLLGTRRTTHSNNSVVRRIKVRPIELRRNSIIRASGHTFEYVGYGPGNYSTTLPERQDRQLTPQQEILAQSFKGSGGNIVFTGMNNDGDFYIGNKKISTTSSEDLVYDTPVPTVTGENKIDSNTNLGANLISVDEITVLSNLKVEGGSEATSISEFNGPIIINNKLTSNSDKGIEAKSLYLQGDSIVSRKYTVGISTPVLAGNPGDVVFKDSSSSGGSIGWVYTLNNQWTEFGPIKDTNGAYTGTFTGTFIGFAGGLSGVSDIWKTDAIGIHTTSKIGVATNTALADYGMYVYGGLRVDGASVFNSSSLRLNVPSGLFLNAGITTISQILDVTANSKFTGLFELNNNLEIKNVSQDVDNYNIRFTNIDTTISSGQKYGGIEWISSDTGNDGVRSYIYGISEGTQGQIGITIGTQNLTGASNPVERIRIGSDGTTTFYGNVSSTGNITAQGTVTASSDQKLKTNITIIENALDKVSKLRGVEYDRIDTNEHQIGLIAQEVETVLPEVVYGQDTKSIAYGNIIGVLVEAIKELKTEIEELKKIK